MKIVSSLEKVSSSVVLFTTAVIHAARVGVQLYYVLLTRKEGTTNIVLLD